MIMEGFVTAAAQSDVESEFQLSFSATLINAQTL